MGEMGSYGRDGKDREGEDEEKERDVKREMGNKAKMNKKRKWM